MRLFIWLKYALSSSSSSSPPPPAFCNLLGLYECKPFFYLLLFVSVATFFDNNIIHCQVFYIKKENFKLYGLHFRKYNV